MSAAAEMTLDCAGVGVPEEWGCGVEEPDIPSALRLRESLLLLENGLMSLAVRVSMVEYNLKETIYMGLAEEPVMEVMRAG
jgi:hypothetical protein